MWVKIQKRKKCFKKNMIGILGIVIGYIVYIFLLKRYPEVTLKILGTLIMLYCTYRFAKSLCLDRGRKRLKAIGWIFAIWTINMVIFVQAQSINVVDAWCLIIAVILGSLWLVQYYYKKDDYTEKFIIAQWMIGYSILAALVFIEIKQMFWIFKLIALFFIVSMVDICKHANRIRGMIFILVAYIEMIVGNGVLNTTLLMGSTEDAYTNFYIAVQNMYSLPIIESLPDNQQIVETMVTYILCRIMDAILLGVTINIISDGKRKLEEAL